MITESSITKAAILALLDEAVTLNSHASMGDHAFWLHVDEDVIQNAVSAISDLNYAIQDERDNPQ